MVRRLLLLLALLPVLARAEPTFEQINAACGVALFADDNLWDDDAAAVAKRLGLPAESRTSVEATYRSYPKPDERFFGARPFSEALLAREDKPVSLSLVFANKGDSVSYLAGVPDGRQALDRRRELRAYRKAIAADEKTLLDAISSVLGPPEAARFSQNRDMREQVSRWDWKGHSFLLAAPRKEYVALRIVPTAVADGAPTDRLSDAEMAALLESRIDRRPNGDVVLGDMPMVNQGPKGYCVPATWERVLRYMGIPADMYVLAMAGGSREGGGTSGDDIMWAVRDAVISSGRRLEKPPVNLTPEGVSRYIDRGVPLIWAMFSTPAFNNAAGARAEARREMTDPAEWSKTLVEPRRNARRMPIDKDSGHMCMIIGYNKKTGEIAVSDSWGPAFAERWVTTEEAQAVSQNYFNVIKR